jgi:hypothetical protein
MLCRLIAVLVLIPALYAQKPAAAAVAQDAPQLADMRDFDAWLQEYRSGAFRMIKNGDLDQAAVTKVDELMARLAKWNSLGAAKKLFEAACIAPVPPGAPTGAQLEDYQRELQPWRVQATARKHLRTMDGPGIVPWLMSMLQAKGIRAAQKNDDQVHAIAVLRILGGHPSTEARLELTKASHSLPPELRVHAVNSLGQDATIESVPDLIDLLRDAEPNVRIAAANALGTALQPQVDETLGKTPVGDVLAARDNAIARLKDVLVHDKIWQVRSAAASGLCAMRCKPVIPALIEGLKAELVRKKDPWAMDVRLHEMLEGLTGRTVLPGQIALWEEFWRNEGQNMAVRPKPKPGEEKVKDSRYQKFFDLDVRSDRVLFVLDFSGSMDEPVTLQMTGTVAKAGTTTTKAELVKAEMKRIVMSLPENTLFNLVVFSDEVHLWRQDREGHPALVKLDDNAKDDLVGSFLDGLRPQGATNLYGALDKALGFGGRGLFDKYYETAFDTLYVLSDGAPSWGEVTDKDEIRRRVRETNALRRITINSVTFGDKNDTDFLRLMAEENGGRHIHVE